MAHPRRLPVITGVVVTVVVGLLYLALIEAVGWNTQQDIWFGLLFILFVGALIENAIRLDAMTEQGSPARIAGPVSAAEPTFGAGLPA